MLIVTAMPTTRTLTEMPNISFVLAEELSHVGIRTPAQLAQVGALEGFQRLKSAGIKHAAYVILALEGAILGIPWQSLPRDRRTELLHLAA